MFSMKRLLSTILILLLNTPLCFGALSNEDRFDLSPQREMTMSEKATLYYGDNNTEEAFQQILKIKDYERTPQDWLLLGNILQDNGKNADAMFMYNRAVAIDKTYYKAYYNLANLYLEENKLNLAIQNYKLASKYNDKFPYAYYNLGCAYLELGQAKNAKIAFLKAIEAKNTVPEFHYNLAYTYKKLGKEKLAKKYLENYNGLTLGN